MIRVLDAAAVLTHPYAGFGTQGKQALVATKHAARVFSPSAGYAIEAVRLLAQPELPNHMVCLVGPTGILADAFLPATKGSASGTLAGPDFPRRARRIHPLNLIRNLQNQVPSALSQVFDIRGQVLNALESASSLAYLLPNMAAMLAKDPKLLLVLASAGDRGEERSKRLCFKKGTMGTEGAFVFLLGREGGRGEITNLADAQASSPPKAATLPGPAIGDPILAAGALLMTCFLEQPEARCIPLADTWGHRSAIYWKE